MQLGTSNAFRRHLGVGPEFIGTSKRTRLFSSFSKSKWEDIVKEMMVITHTTPEIVATIDNKVGASYSYFHCIFIPLNNYYEILNIFTIN